MPGLTRVMLLAVLLGGGGLTFAQQMGFSIGPQPHFAAPPRGSGLTISFNATPTRSFHRQLLLPGFYDPSFFYPDTYQTVIPASASPSPQVIVLQQPQEVRAEPKPPELLLLERRGTRFVRLRAADAAADSENAKPDVLNSASSSESRLPKRSETMPTVLVFSDGRREETVSYTIADGFLYEAADYWNTGTWTKRVSLANLDLRATRRENQLRGVQFLLPSGPHEVMVH